MVTAIINAGGTNCWTEPTILAMEPDMHTNDFTPQRDSACTVRPRMYHQANHALWVINPPWCGALDASGSADFTVNISRSDGGWTYAVV